MGESGIGKSGPESMGDDFEGMTGVLVLFLVAPQGFDVSCWFAGPNSDAPLVGRVNRRSRRDAEP